MLHKVGPQVARLGPSKHGAIAERSLLRELLTGHLNGRDVIVYGEELKEPPAGKGLAITNPLQGLIAPTDSKSRRWDSCASSTASESPIARVRRAT